MSDISEQPIQDDKFAKNRVQDSMDERRRAALREIDDAKFSFFHVKACLVAGVGFLTDAYDVFGIGLCASMIGKVYGHNHALTAAQDLGLKVATPVGTLVGQLLFGWLADVVGRKRMYGVELMIIIVATVAQALSGAGPAVSIVGVLVVWRFLMGVGVGGDYPLSSIITSEFAATRIRGRMMACVFSAQGYGQFLAALVGFIATMGYKNAIINGSTNFEAVDVPWRIIIGMGAVPGAIALYFRLTISETPRYTLDVERNVLGAAADISAVVNTGHFNTSREDEVVLKVDAPKASWADFWRYNGQWKNGKVLFGAAWSWFALDIAFYGLGLNSSIVLGAIGFGGAAPAGSTVQYKAWKSMHDACVGNMVLSAGGLIPGFWFAIAFIDKWGRKPIQYMGFGMLTIIFVVMGFGYDKLLSTSAGTKGFVVLYVFANFFQNFGPNTTTFIVPGECFPTRYRSTSHGITAASGKLGAILAQVAFAQLKDRGGTNAWVKHLLEIFALFMLTGLFSTYLIPETKGKTLEELSGEDQDDFIHESSAASSSHV